MTFPFRYITSSLLAALGVLAVVIHRAQLKPTAAKPAVPSVEKPSGEIKDPAPRSSFVFKDTGETIELELTEEEAEALVNERHLDLIRRGH